MELKNHFKIPLKKVNGKTSITEVKYIGADGKEYIGLEFEGYASTSELDRGGDITLPTAFNDTLKAYMENSMMLLQHDDNKPIGTFTEVTVDSNGLYVKGLVKVDVDNVFQKLRTGVLKTMSIGYRILDYSIETIEKSGEEIDAFVIKILELFEISLVSVPMAAGAQIKSLDGLSDKEVKELYDTEKEDIYTFSSSVKDLSNKVKNLNTNNLPMKVKIKETDKTIKETIEEEVKIEEEIVDVKEEITDDKIEEKEEEKIETEEEVIEEKSIENVRIKTIDGEKTLYEKLTDALRKDLGDDENAYIIEFTENKVVYNHRSYGINDFDKYFKADYAFTEGIAIIGNATEVEPMHDWEQKTVGFKKEKEVKENEKKEEVTKENEEVVIEEEIVEKKEEEETKETSEKKAGETADENKSVVDLKFDKKALDEMVKASITQIEKTFEEHKEITSKEVKDLFKEQKDLFEKQIDDFAGILVEALTVFEETNGKAQKYIAKIENSPIAKTYRYQESNQKPENPLSNLIKQIKR